MTFASSYLSSRGWKGEGHGLRSNSRAKPIIPTQKKNNHGVGKDRDEAFPWWEDVFNIVAKKVGGTRGSGQGGEKDSFSFTQTGIISSRKGPLPENAPKTTPDALALAKQNVARKMLYSGFRRGPVIGGFDESLPQKDDDGEKGLNGTVDDAQRKKRDSKKRKRKEPEDKEDQKMRKKKRQNQPIAEEKDDESTEESQDESGHHLDPDGSIQQRFEKEKKKKSKKDKKLGDENVKTSKKRKRGEESGHDEHSAKTMAFLDDDQLGAKWNGRIEPYDNPDPNSGSKREDRKKERDEKKKRRRRDESGPELDHDAKPGGTNEDQITKAERKAKKEEKRQKKERKRMD